MRKHFYYYFIESGSIKPSEKKENGSDTMGFITGISSDKGITKPQPKPIENIKKEELKPDLFEVNKLTIKKDLTIEMLDLFFKITSHISLINAIKLSVFENLKPTIEIFIHELYKCEHIEEETIFSISFLFSEKEVPHLNIHVEKYNSLLKSRLIRDLLSINKRTAKETKQFLEYLEDEYDFK